MQTASLQIPIRQTPPAWNTFKHVKCERKWLIIPCNFEKTIPPVPLARDLGMVFRQHIDYDENVTGVVFKSTTSLSIGRSDKHVGQNNPGKIVNASFFSRLFTYFFFFFYTSKKNLLNYKTWKVLWQSRSNHKSDMLGLRDAALTFQWLRGLDPPRLSKRFIYRFFH